MLQTLGASILGFFDLVPQVVICSDRSEVTVFYVYDAESRSRLLFPPAMKSAKKTIMQDDAGMFAYAKIPWLIIMFPEICKLR